MIQKNEATEAQVRTADPNSSTWVAANAGSGKTRVLTERVARLLIQGTNPSHILCLTYTKAAAAEMQNRLFKQLGEWSMLPDAELTDRLFALGQTDAVSSDALRRTRTLFAAALETPGGLKIQTIHAFCTSVLRKFPLEAGLSPQFAVFDDREKASLIQEIVDDIALEQPALIDDLAEQATNISLDQFVTDLISKRAKFQRAPTRFDFSISEGSSIERIHRDLFSVKNISLLNSLADLMTSGVTNLRDADTIKSAVTEQSALDALNKIASVFLYKSGDKASTAKIDKVPSGKVLDEKPDLRQSANDFARAVENAHVELKGLLAFFRSDALFRFAKVFLGKYSNCKTELAKLDFDDLLEKTVALLSSSSMAQWVLYRLDGGIDHILVDEAQDTSPIQWQIIELLASEFTSGVGASDTDRTLFVVGDAKQSIYSFQGAEADAFAEMREKFDQKLQDSEQRLERSELLYSFRSSAPILELVDQVFEAEERNTGRPHPKHLSFHADRPGRIDLWPLIEKDDDPEENDWFVPNNSAAPNDPQLKLAKEIASFVEQTISSKQPIFAEGKIRPVQEKDVLILLQRRSSLFHFIIKELKSRNLKIAGADALKIGTELAVKDILSTLKFLATPEDDLSLAEALRSPIFGLSEQDLFTAAHNRTGFLWEEIRSSESLADTTDKLWSLLSRADFLRPYELIMQILTDLKGRENLLARLGQEAEDGINALLEQSLLYEQAEPPTLSGFLNWFDSGDVEVKRNLDSGSDQIRVMTVHGAKGLEAPVVILPDTIRAKEPKPAPLADHPDGFVTWPANKAMRSSVEAKAIASQSESQRKENMRLLYVAMTRAESWLIVCGAKGALGKAAFDWHAKIASAMEHLPLIETPLEDGRIALTYKNNAWDSMPLGQSSVSEPDQVVIPEWLYTYAEKLPRPVQSVSPSNLPGPKSISSGQEITSEDAKAEGTLLHLLLEHLPHQNSERRDTIIQNICEGFIELSDAAKDRVTQRALSLISDASLKDVFSKDAFVEVTLSAEQPIEGHPPLLGTIDRLILSETTAWVIDFKSNQTVPKTPENIPLGILRQMAAYYHMIVSIYPEKQIALSILWTRTGQLMTIPHEIVKVLLQSPLHLDQEDPRS